MYSMRFEVMMVLICRMIAAGNAAASMLEAVQSPAEYEEVAKTALQVRTWSPGNVPCCPQGALIEVAEHSRLFFFL